MTTVTVADVPHVDWVELDRILCLADIRLERSQADDAGVLRDRLWEAHEAWLRRRWSL
jgi:hypothetical protein